MIKQVYKTADGTIFEDWDKARDHEEDQLSKWLASNPLIDLFAVLNTLEPNNTDEIFGSSRDLGMFFVRKAYELTNVQHGNVPEDGEI